MRFFIAAGLFVASVLTLLLGLAERTIWAPPENYTKSLKLENNKSLVLVPNEILLQHPGNPTIYAEGSEEVFLATGREADLIAWIGASAHVTLSVNESDAKLESEVVSGLENVDAPSGSDLWRTEKSSKDAAFVKAEVAEEAAVLVASDGLRPAPDHLRIVWPVTSDFTTSNIILIIGGILLFASFVMNLIALYHMRKTRGPRRRTPTPPRPPKYRFKRVRGNTPVRGRRSARRAFFALPISAIVLVTGSGCTSMQQVAPSPSPSISAIEAPPVAVVPEQITKILDDVEKIAEAADLTSDKQLLTPRFSGPALALRAAHYVLRARSTSIGALPKIVGEPISFSLPAATDSWPRTMMVVTDERGTEALPQMLVFQQANPRSNYRLWYNMRLMPGAEIPEVPSAEIGAIPIASDSLFLKLAPKDLANGYSDIIDKGASSLSFGLFDTTNDEFYRQVSTSQKSQVEALTNGKIAFSHSLGNKNVISLATSNAGALVAIYMTDTYRITPKNRGSAVAVSGQEKLLLGADGSTRGVRSTYGEMLLFYVPALSDPEKIRLLGVTQGLLSVRSL